MLSRTANELFWMARHIERAENTARMLNVNYETSLLPQAVEAAEMMERLRISQLLVADREGRLVGALNHHDLMLAKVI